MNKKVLATAMVVLGLFPSLLFAQLYRMEVDAQESGSQKVIDRVFTGNTVGLQVSFYDGGDPLPVTNWTMRFMYGYGQYDTNGMVPVFGTAGVSNNVVVFDSATNVFFSENGSYYFSIVGTNTAGKVRTFARGRMIEEYDPATGGSYINGIPMPWANLNFASKEWIVEYISTNEFETVVSYGTNSTTAFRGDWGDAVSNLAAWSSNNFSNAWVRGESVTNAVDATARAGVSSNAASIVAVGAVASNAVQKSGGIMTGTLNSPALGIGTTQAIASISTPFSSTSPVLVHAKGGAIIAERQYADMYGSNAVSAIGYDLRNQGEANLWLNSAWASAITNWNRATVLFGRGGELADASIGWSLSFRPPGTATHDGFDQLAIFEGPAVAGVTAKRFGIFPTGAVTIVYGNGDASASAPMSTRQPQAGAALTVYGTEGESRLALIGNYTNASAGRGTLVLGAGASSRSMLTYGGSDESVSMIVSNGWGTNTAYGIDKTGRVFVGKMTITNATIQSLTLGRNAPVSDWPASGGGISDGDSINALTMTNATVTRLDVVDQELGGTNVVRAIEYNPAGDGWKIAGRSEFGQSMTAWDAITNLPTPGCLVLPVNPSTSNAWVGSGNYESYTITNATMPINLQISNSVYRRYYQITILSTQAVTLATNMVRIGAAWTPTGTNLVVIWPHCDAALWRVKGQAQ